MVSLVESPSSLGIESELESGCAGQLHLRVQQQRMSLLDSHDSPEVQCLAKFNIFRVPPPPSQPWTAYQLVHPTPNFPEDIPRISAMPTADTANG